MIKYYSHGSGDVVVLIHGFCENSTCFNKQVSFLKDHYNVITFDLPGFGESLPKAGLSMGFMAQQIAFALNELSVEKCIMLGHSMGGYVTLEFANLYPEKLLAFGLIHSTTEADSEEKKDKRIQVVDFLAKNGKDEFIKTFIPGLFYDLKKFKAESEFAVEEALKGSTQGLIDSTIAMIHRHDYTDFIKTTSFPVFFAIGKYDSVIPENSMLKQATLCAKSEICYLENSAHMSMMEEPEKLNTAIHTFAKRIFEEF